jgi:hypothetical protein
VRVPGEAPPAVDQALGFEIMHLPPNREIVMHGGQTGGYQTTLMLEPTKGRAVVALSNSQAAPAPDDIALHILIGLPVAPTPPVPPPPPPPSKHVEISLPAAELERFVGRYDMGSGFAIDVTLDNGVLRVQRVNIPGAQILPVYPETPLAFFWKVVDAQLRFVTDASGAVTGAEFKQGALVLTGKRVAP